MTHKPERQDWTKPAAMAIPKEGYPYVSAEEIKKALRVKASFSNMLDQMQ